MKKYGSSLVLVLCGLCLRGSTLDSVVNVSQHHNAASRAGLYIDPAFTVNAASNLVRDLGFDGMIDGNAYAQPLYIEGGPGGRAVLLVVTESDNVYALDPSNGSVVWKTSVGTPVPLSAQLCGNIDPLGITGTPIVDLTSRSLFFDALTTPDGGTTSKHLIFSLNVDTGTTNAGWPVDVSTVTFGNQAFDSSVQNQRGALAIVLNRLYVPYGGRYGDCGNYHGWVVGVPLNNPSNVLTWATTATRGGCWAVGGIASDGMVAYAATGNTQGATVWSGGDAIIRLQPGPVFSGLSADYWAPTNWPTLDQSDLDLGSSGPLLVEVAGANPSQLVVALGKDGYAYLLNRTNLGGISPPLAKAFISGVDITQAAATYKTSQGTYVVCASTGNLYAFRITPTSPPTIVNSWNVNQHGEGSPFVTSTDGTNNLVVWVVGCEGDQRLHGYDPDTGALVYDGGGANELMTGTRHMNTAIAARGRIYMACDNKVYAFKVIGPPYILLQPTDQSALPGGTAAFQVAGSSTSPVGYQWLFYGTNLLGATSNILSLTNVQPSMAGPYSVVLTNAGGSITSVVATLTVLSSPQILRITQSGNTVSIDVETVAGSDYLLQYADSLGPGNWTSLPPSVAGTGLPTTLQDTNATVTARFYRVLVQ